MKETSEMNELTTMKLRQIALEDELRSLLLQQHLYKKVELKRHQCEARKSAMVMSKKCSRYKKGGMRGHRCRHVLRMVALISFLSRSKCLCNIRELLSQSDRFKGQHTVIL